MSENDEAQLTEWLDVLEEVVNGHLEGLACPFCSAKPLQAEMKGALVRVRCGSCGEYFEGRVP